MRNLYRITALLAATVFLCCSCEKDGGDEKPSGKPYIKLGFSEKLVSAKSGSFEVYVNSNTSWTVEPLAGWITVDPSEGEGSKNIRISYESNYLEGTQTPAEPRTGTVRFSADGTVPVKVTIKQGARSFKNPIFQPLPDPYVWRDEQNGTAYYYVCKAASNKSKVPCINLGKSNSLVSLGSTKEVWSLPTSPSSWNKQDLWAPELFHINDENGDYWYIYYAAGNPAAAGISGYGSQRTGVIRCPGNLDPTVKGSWEDMGMIYTGNDPYHGQGNKANTIDNTIYAIDMTTFEYNGQRYAVWSGNINKNENVGGIPYKGGDQALYIATMENPWTINSARVEISRADQSWEMKTAKLNEGPAMIFNPSGTKLFCVYSCNQSRTKEYCLGWLEFDLTGNPTPEDFMNPENWKKSNGSVFSRIDHSPSISEFPIQNPKNEDLKNPLYMHIGGVQGVGHNCFTKSPDGTEDWIVYHNKRFVEDGWDYRDCFIQRFTWDAQGYPVFGEPVGWQEEIEVPSGEPL